MICTADAKAPEVMLILPKLKLSREPRWYRQIFSAASSAGIVPVKKARLKIVGRGVR